MKSTRSSCRRKPKQFIVAAATVIVSVLVTLLTLEVCVRIFFPRYGIVQKIVIPNPRSDSRAYILKPGARIVFSGSRQRLDKPVVWQINAQGIRSERLAPPRSEKFRIATFGDSETFGWSVPLDFTFQRRMEKIDDNVEVLNLGIPGYNVENSADHMEEMLPRLKADFVFYHFNGNDTDPPLTFSPTLSKSQLYIFYRKSQATLLRTLFPKDSRRKDSPESFAYLANQIDRMIEICRRDNAPLLIGFVGWKFQKFLQSSRQLDCTRSLESTACSDSHEPGFSIVSINPEQGWKWRSLPTLDHHMSQVAHQKTAKTICREISVGRENSCVPPYRRSAQGN